MIRPQLIIVSGLSATGKTTLAKKIGELKSLPVICKDDIKESLFDSIGYESIEKVEMLEKATYDLLFLTARSILKASKSVIIESDVTDDFNEERVGALQKEFGANILQISCQTNGTVLYERFKSRMTADNQHPGHYEEYYLENYPEFADSLKSGISKPLAIESEVITLDTTNFEQIDYDLILNKING